MITKEQIEELNKFQNSGIFHPMTCLNDGDNLHIMYEFNKHHKGEDYNEYIQKKKLNGIKFPEMEFNQTNLIPTQSGWICPVCNYTQKIEEL